MSNDNKNIILSDESPLTKFVTDRGVMIKTVDIYPNTGQIPGVPKNHMEITEKGIQDLDNSLTEDPEFLFANPLTIIPYAGKYVVLAGNQRLKRCMVLGITEVPCDILNPLISVDKLKRFILKDNINYGVIDWDILANEWEYEISELEHFGINLPDITIPDEAAADDEKGSTEAPNIKLTVKFTSNVGEYERVKELIKNAIEGFEGIEIS